MQHWSGVANVPADWGRSVVSVGVFDGVHRGHREVLSRAAERARQLRFPVVVITFAPNPLEVLRPGAHPGDLTTVAHRVELLAAAGADAVVIEPFTLQLSQVAPEDFVVGHLVDRLHAAAVVVGANFRYGHRAAGDLDLLAKLGDRYGFDVEGVELVTDGESVYSSTTIRQSVLDGAVDLAAAALGRPHRMEGTVVVGDRRGRELGYPTANLKPTASALMPADGIYAGWLVRARGDGPPPPELRGAEERLPAAISIGTNPTFDGVDRRVEAYVLDREDLDLYGKWVYFDFAARLRDTLRFDSVPELVAQMGRDVARCREVVVAA